jgi:hypothetical protein
MLENLFIGIYRYLDGYATLPFLKAQGRLLVASLLEWRWSEKIRSILGKAALPSLGSS